MIVCTVNTLLIYCLSPGFKSECVYRGMMKGGGNTSNVKKAVSNNRSYFNKPRMRTTFKIRANGIKMPKRVITTGKVSPKPARSILIPYPTMIRIRGTVRLPRNSKTAITTPVMGNW